MWSQGSAAGIFPNDSLPYFLRLGLSLNPELASAGGPSELQGSVCLLSSAGIADTHKYAGFLCEFPGFELVSSCLHREY